MAEWITEPRNVTVEVAPKGVIITMVSGPMGINDYKYLLTPRQVAHLRRDLTVELEATLNALKSALDGIPAAQNETRWMTGMVNVDEEAARGQASGTYPLATPIKHES